MTINRAAVSMMVRGACLTGRSNHDVWDMLSEEERTEALRFFSAETQTSTEFVGGAVYSAIISDFKVFPSEIRMKINAIRFVRCVTESSLLDAKRFIEGEGSLKVNPKQREILSNYLNDIVRVQKI